MIGRKHPAHFPVTERFNTPIIVFLTVCTKNRRKILCNDEAHYLLLASWQTNPTWLVGRYVVMPDHIHMFCAPNSVVPAPLRQWVSFWKSDTARRWPHLHQSPVWQRHFWDTQLRRGENYDEKWVYIMNNPVRAGLVTHASEWHYHGEVNLLPWW